MTLSAVPPFIRDRNIRFDLCASCTMPRSDRHHRSGYRMHRSPYDIPGHPFMDPALSPILVPAPRAADPCNNGHCVRHSGHDGDHLDRWGDSFPRPR